MASLHQYRPPPARESYVPPVISNGTRATDRSSKSPSKRREIPPAVPSPPTLSSRNSPPRRPSFSSRAAAQSPTKQQVPPTPTHGARTAMPPNQWLFTSDEVLSSPSILDGLSPAEERLRRAKGVNFIYQAGILLELPQITLYVAGVFFHRFYVRYSMVEEKGGIHHYNIAATALFLANKTEENCRKTKDIIIAVAKVAQKNSKLIIDEQAKEYWRWRDSILMYEEVMLEHLTFDLIVANPHKELYKLLEQINQIHNKAMRHAAWAFCNDACLTTLPLLMEAREIAVASIFFSSNFTSQRIDDIEGQPWWKHLNGNEGLIVKAVQVAKDFYVENPLRKQENPYQGSPEFSLENTRGGGGSSTNVTPRTDRDTASPRGGARANGTTDATMAEISSQNMKESQSSSTIAAEEASRAAPGDSDAVLKEAANDLATHSSTGEKNGLISPRPPKRRDGDISPEAEDPRDQKRRRVSGDDDDDGDEGEVLE